MKMAGIKVHLVIIFLLLTLVILVVGNMLYQKYYLTEPLFKLYQKTKVVQDYHVDGQGRVKKVLVEMKKTNNLQKSYNELLAGTAQVLGNSEITLELKDRRNDKLEKIYYDSQLIIYEALLKGNFTNMAEAIKKQAKAAGAEAQISIDKNNIYLQLVQGDNYLYEIIPRNTTDDKSFLNQRGSDQNA